MAARLTTLVDQETGTLREGAVVSVGDLTMRLTLSAPVIATGVATAEADEIDRLAPARPVCR